MNCIILIPPFKYSFPRTPEEWVRLGEINGVCHPVPARAFVPLKDVEPETTYLMTLGEKQGKQDLPVFGWVHSAVMGYDPATKLYQVVITRNNLEHQLPRIYVLFRAEDPQIFAARLKDAVDRRKEVENAIR